MSNTCQLSGKKLQFGNKISHSNRKTRRKFLLNSQKVSFISDFLGKISLTIATSTIRTIDRKGGIDSYLLNSRASHLSDEAIRLRNRVKKAKAKKEAKTANK